MSSGALVIFPYVMLNSVITHHMGSDTMPSDDKVRFTLRMPPDLYAKVKESADKNKRSVAREIEFIVEKMMSLEEPSTDSKQ